MNTGTSETQERLIVGRFTLVPYTTGRGRYPLEGEQWAMPGCNRQRPSYLSTEQVKELARRAGLDVKRVKVQIYRRGDGI